MSSNISTRSIEQAVEKYRVKNIKIENEKSIQLSSELKNQILNKSDNHSICISLLGTILKLSNQNDGFYNIFTESLIDEIFLQIYPENSIENINSSLTILASIINGEIFQELPPSQYSIPILNSTNTNLKVLEIISNKLLEENTELMLLSLSFVNRYLELDHVEFNSINHLAEFILHLQKSEFLVTLGNSSLDERFKDVLNKPMLTAQLSYQKNVSVLMNLKIDLNSKYQNEILNTVLNQVTKVGIDKEKELTLEKFSVFHLIDLYFFLENTNITFKKSYHQQILFNSNKLQKFPLVLASLKVSNFLNEIFNPNSNLVISKNLSRFFFLREILQYNLINNFLEIWVNSKAEFEDFDNLFDLIKILLEQITLSLNNTEDLNPINKVLIACKQNSYKTLRSIQLESYKSHINQITNSETKGFNKLLNDQTFEFVKNQRFLSLSQGTWVYSQLPSTRNPSNNSYHFIILSPNFKQLLYKEFKTKSDTKPNIDKIGSSIDISSITNFEIEEILQVDKSAPPPSNSKLINLTNKTIINKISLLNRKNKVLFQFYDKKEDSLVWLDGLNLLIGNDDNLSNNLRVQLSKLYDVRKTVQLLNFDEKIEHEFNNDYENGDNSNNLEYLEKLTKNFYYT